MTQKLAVSTVWKSVYFGEQDEFGIFTYNRVDVTEDFKQCLVEYCGAYAVIEVDGKKYEVSCKEIK